MLVCASTIGKGKKLVEGEALATLSSSPILTRVS
jgi:hypothetical protein